MYFVISSSDGDTSVNPMERNELLKAIHKKHYGDDVKFLKEIERTGTNYWNENDILIIKGEIVTPQPKLVVEEFVI